MVDLTAERRSHKTARFYGPRHAVRVLGLQSRLEELPRTSPRPPCLCSITPVSEMATKHVDLLLGLRSDGLAFRDVRGSRGER